MTGRTHQLRVHMAAIGHPIVGDGKYGGPEAFLTGAISRKLHLHARRLRIDHPDGGSLDVVAEPPPHLADSLAYLGFDPALGDRPDEAAQRKPPAPQRRPSRRGERRSRGRG
jgi:23S rRNA pseudouridine955/2504/2580 synthase